MVFVAATVFENVSVKKDFLKLEGINYYVQIHYSKTMPAICDCCIPKCISYKMFLSPAGIIFKTGLLFLLMIL
jgi:hypothetical protein